MAVVTAETDQAAYSCRCHQPRRRPGCPTACSSCYHLPASGKPLNPVHHPAGQAPGGVPAPGAPAFPVHITESPGGDERSASTVLMRELPQQLIRHRLDHRAVADPDAGAGDVRLGVVETDAAARYAWAQV